MKLNYATIKPFEELKLKSSLDSSYSTIKKELDDAIMDVVTVDELDFWFNDEFLFNEKPIPTVIIKNNRVPNITNYDIVLCGNVVIASHDEEGNTVSLTEEAINKLKQFKLAFLGVNPVYIYENY